VSFNRNYCCSGALVKTLEATQKKLVAASEQNEEQNVISDTHRRKERERVQKEVSTVKVY
jgi:hypothetical protein